MGRKSRKDRTPAGRIAPDATNGTENRYAAPAVCGFLVLAVLLIFGRSVGYDFVNFDDDLYVYQNPHLSRGLTTEGIAWAMTTTQCDNWHPLTWLSFLFDYQVHGPAPWGYHFTNVLLHAAAAVALFLALRRMTGELWPSAFVAAVFALHPLRVESVAWVAERKDALSGLFFMLTLAAYAGYVRHSFSLVRYLIVIVLFALGLTAKPMLVTLPLVLLLLDYWPLDRMRLGWRVVVEKLPLLALSVASCAATAWAQRQAATRLDILPMIWRIANALVSYAAYLGALFYPAGLAVFYPHPKSGLPPWQIAGAAALLAGICVVVWVWRRSRPYLAVGWLWYLGMLVPVIGLVQVGQHSMADRYTYLPQIGLAIGLTWGAKQFFQAWPQRAWWQGVIAAALLASLMGGTWQQMSFWRDSESLWRHALECTPDNVLAYNNLGLALRDQDRIGEAIAQYEQALKLKPNDVMAHVNLGAAFYQQGRTDEAIAHLQRAVALKPDYAVGQNNLGTALLAQGRSDEAMVHYRKAVELDSEYIDARYNLGVLLDDIGRTPEAMAQWREVLRLQPGNVLALSQLAAALAETGRFAEAVETAQRALVLASGRNDAGLADSIRAHIKLYQHNSPYHEVRPPSTSDSDHP